MAGSADPGNTAADFTLELTGINLHLSAPDFLL
jgi:hypothetical protein